MRLGEIEHGRRIAESAEAVWNWSSPAGTRRAMGRAARIIEAAALTSADHCLEIGCGTGLFTERFARAGCRLVAVDVCESLLHKAEKREACGGVSFQVQDAEHLSFRDGSFDVVLGSSVLHHLDAAAAVAELHRVLVPGGRMVFAEPNMMNPQIALQRHVPWLRRWAGESPEETAFVRWSLTSRLAQAGFVDVRIQPFDFLHPLTPVPFIDIVNKLGSALERVPVVREIAGSLLIRARRSC